MELIGHLVPSEKEMEEYEKLRKSARKVEGKTISEWPKFEINWDYSYENLHYFADGWALNTIVEKFPDGLMVADISLNDLDRKLTRGSCQKVHEFWDIGLRSKKSEAIAHWLNGGVMTPCKIAPHGTDEIIISGGHHRLAVCRAKSLQQLPVLFEPTHQARLDEILKLKNIRIIQSST